MKCIFTTGVAQIESNDKRDRICKESSVSFVLHLRIPTYSSTNRQVVDAQRRCFESRPLARTFAFSTFYFLIVERPHLSWRLRQGYMLWSEAWLSPLNSILFIFSAGAGVQSIIDGYVFGFVREKVMSKTNDFTFLSCQKLIKTKIVMYIIGF